MKEVKRYVEAFEKGQMSRRNFVKGLTALGLSVTAINTILAGSGSRAMAATPVKGGRARAILWDHGPNDTIDPAKSVSCIDAIRAFQIHNGLVAASPKLEPLPALAESWEPNKTADEWVFKLRKGVEFHDGRSFGAEDVIYSYQRVLDPKTGSGGKPQLSSIKEMKILDSHTVFFKLVDPDADFPVLLSNRFSLIVPAGFTDFDHAIGTGPFRVKEFKPGIRCVVERNPNYWKTGLPHLDEVETFGLGDGVGRANDLLAGDVEYIYKLDVKLLDKVNQTPGVKVMSGKSGMFDMYNMNCTIPPYTDNNVREAMKCALDRERYMEVVHKGYATPGNDHPVSPMHADYCDTLPPRVYDPDKAKFLMKKAGALDFTHEVFTMEGLAGTIEGILLWRQTAAKAGIKIKLTRAPSDGYWDHTWMKKPFFASEYMMRPTANMIMSLVWKSDAPWNESAWRRPDFDKILIEARGTLDKAKRREMYCELQRMIRDDAGTLIPCFKNHIDAGSEKLHAEIHPMRPMEGFFFENAWLET